jgi:hypothetical protein
MSSSTDTPDSHPAGRRDNGLAADSFVPLAEVDAQAGAGMLIALGRSRIAAYLEPTADPARELLYAASGDRADALTIIAAVARSSERSAGDSGAPLPIRAPAAPDPLAGRDTEAEFKALVADWHVDTVAAIKSAERDLSREDSEWRARIVPPAEETEDPEIEEHFVPPAPPPLPRLSAMTICALVLIALSIAMLIFGDRLGLGYDFAFMVGIGGILVGAGMFVMKLRAHPDEDDDGAIL